MNPTKDLKTTITAIVGMLAFLLAKLGVLTIPPEYQDSIVMVTIFVLGLFARDGTRIVFNTSQPPNNPPAVASMASAPMQAIQPNAQRFPTPLQ